MKFVFSPDVILCGWLGSKHQLTNSLSPLSLSPLPTLPHPLDLRGRRKRRRKWFSANSSSQRKRGAGRDAKTRTPCDIWLHVHGNCGTAKATARTEILNTGMNTHTHNRAHIPHNTLRHAYTPHIHTHTHTQSCTHPTQHTETRRHSTHTHTHTHDELHPVPVCFLQLVG